MIKSAIHCDEPYEGLFNTRADKPFGWVRDLKTMLKSRTGSKN